MPVKVLASFLAALFLLAIPGCNGSREMDQMAFVAALGLDVGQGNALEVSFAISNPMVIAGGSSSSDGGGGGPGGKPTLVAGVEAPSVDAAINLINSSLSRRVTLEQMKAVFISERLARQGVRPVLLAMLRYPEFRDTAFVFVNRGRTADLLQKNKPYMETTPAKQFELVMSNGKRTGHFPYIQLKAFLNAMESHGTNAIAPLAAINPSVNQRKKGLTGQAGPAPAAEKPYLAGQVPAIGNNPFEIMGTAVFRGDQLVGFLDGESTRMLLMLRGEFEQAIFTLPDPRAPGNQVVLLVRQRQKPSVTVESSEQGFKVNEKIALEYDLESVQSGQTYECPSQSGQIDRLLADFVQQKATGVIQLAQRRYRSDILRWGLYAAHTVPTWDEWEKLNWQSQFPGASVDVTVSASMRRPGMLLDTGTNLEDKQKCLSLPTLK